MVRLYEWFIEHQVAMDLIRKIADARYNAYVGAYLVDPDTVAEARILLDQVEREKKQANEGSG
jgi:hypothetical protein